VYLILHSLFSLIGPYIYGPQNLSLKDRAFSSYADNIHVSHAYVWTGQINVLYNTVTDLINVMPGNSSVNTVQHATIEEAVFSVSAVTSRSGGWWSRDVFPLKRVRSLAI
jgi:hypothetical protein